METITETVKPQEKIIDLEKLVQWGPAKRVETKLGPKMLRKAPATPAFWAAWRAGKEQLKKAGISCGQDQQTGDWCAMWWMPIAKEIVEAENATIEMSKATDAAIDIPKPDGLDYMPFQRAGVRFAVQREGCMIGDDMGLGKTIQAIGVVNYDASIKKIVVVTKASLKQNWANELRKWLVRPMRVAVQHASEPWAGGVADVVIINYDICKKFKADLDAIVWDAAIVDEIQNCKNRKAQRTEVVLGAPKRKKNGEMVEAAPGIRARRRIALTGTPVEQRPEELYTVLRWLDPVAWPSFWKYATRYCGAHFDGYTTNTQGDTHLDELQRKLRSTIMIRRLKGDVLKELPAKTRMVVELEPDEAIEAALEQESELFHRHEGALTEARAAMEVERLSDKKDGFADEVKKMWEGNRLAFEEIAKARHDTAVAKVPRLIEALQDDIESNGCKILVFAHHHDVLDPLNAAFPGSVLITGETPPDKRQAIVDRFQKEPGCGPFFGSIRATGEGLTLTAAQLVVFGEEDWVPGKITQAEDRAHRIGQKGNVLVKHYVVNGSIDIKIAKSHIAKQTVIDRALDKDMLVVEAQNPVLSVEIGSVLEEPVKREHTEPDMTQEQIQAVLTGLQELAGVCDGARKRDECGFNAMDAAFGHALARQGWLSQKQAHIGRRLLNKYRRQLGTEIMDASGITTDDSNGALPKQPTQGKE